MARLLTYQSGKWILAFLLNAIMSFICGLFFVWWSVALVSFVVYFSLRLRAWAAFFSAFLSMFLLWTSLTLYVSFHDNFHASRLLSQLFLGVPIAGIFNILTGLMIGMVSAFSASCAAHARRIIKVAYPSIVEDVRADNPNIVPPTPIPASAIISTPILPTTPAPIMDQPSNTTSEETYDPSKKYPPSDLLQPHAKAPRDMGESTLYKQRPPFNSNTFLDN